jgi:ribosomal protein S18 acetylase RimI-like enzyme
VGARDIAVVRTLFQEYAGTLPVDLAYQGFADELASLPGDYGAPTGALFLAETADGTCVGCAALRRGPEAGVGEIKRLYVRPGVRGLGIGERLSQAVIAAARRAGYTALVLDTLPTMAAAQELYRRLGFVVTAPYYAPTPEGTVFMALRLR